MENTDLRVIKRKQGYVIQDFANNRSAYREEGKVIYFGSKTDAKAYRDKLMAAVARKELRFNQRYKFKEVFHLLAQERWDHACDVTKKLTKQGARGYLSYSKRHIAKWFPDIHLDELDARSLNTFAETCFKNDITYKTVKDIIQHIHTALRWMLERKYHDNFESALNWKIYKQHHLLPADRDDQYERKTEVITNEEAVKVLNYVQRHRHKSHDDALTYGIFTILAAFGLRPSEIQGLKRSNFNFEKRFVTIKGAYLGREGGYRNRTKNDDSNRPIDYDANQAEDIEWIYNYMSKYKPHNPYFFPASRLGDDQQHHPVSQYKVRKLVYAAYEACGLAKLEWFTKGKTEQYKIIDCRFKNGPMKCWRHYNATSMIDNMFVLGLTPNYIKSRLGHSRWQTTQDRYGNHNLGVSEEMRMERAEKVSKALGYNK
jgi:integrase